jgi:indole-3-glycerol phosphate synthase
VGSVLRAAMAAAKRAAEVRSERTPAAALERQLAERRRPRGSFRAALTLPGIRIIAECKRRSPSRGILRRAYDPAAIARGYERAGAAAISVLTEPTFFDGALTHLEEVRAAVGIPLLRKDFVSTEYQVLEAAAAGAEAVLLIVAGLETAELMSLHRVAQAFGLDVLVEVHDEAELVRAMAVGAAIIGVNSRNLNTLEVDVATFDRLLPLMPRNVVRVAESGLKDGHDLRRLREAGYHAFLVGERFMSAEAPGHALADLITQARSGAPS